MSTIDYSLGPHLVSASNHMLKVAVDIFSCAFYITMAFAQCTITNFAALWVNKKYVFQVTPKWFRTS